MLKRTEIRVDTECVRLMWGEDDAPTKSSVKNPPGEWHQEEDGGWRFYRDEQD